MQSFVIVKMRAKEKGMGREEKVVDVLKVKYCLSAKQFIFNLYLRIITV